MTTRGEIISQGGPLEVSNAGESVIKGAWVSLCLLTGMVLPGCSERADVSSDVNQSRSTPQTPGPANDQIIKKFCYYKFLDAVKLKMAENQAGKAQDLKAQLESYTIEQALKVFADADLLKNQTNLTSQMGVQDCAESTDLPDISEKSKPFLMACSINYTELQEGMLSPFRMAVFVARTPLTDAETKTAKRAFEVALQPLKGRGTITCKPMS